MSYLVQVSLGPVQGFIATARRSRDLWFGSYILSEISKAVALYLHRSRATLIFPSPAEPDRDLEPWSDFLVVNLVTAESGADGPATVRALLDGAEQAAALHWARICREARESVGRAVDGSADDRLRAASAFIDDAIWNAQLTDVVEVFTAAVSLGADYRQANRDLRVLMSNRKNTRDFSPYRDKGRKPKSSLDGAQSTVILEQAVARTRRRLGIEDGEQLDTAGLVKRVAGRRRGFVPVARVSAAPWIERAGRLYPEAFSALVKVYGGLTSDDFATELDRRYREYGWIEPFPFDAEMLYAERIDAELAARRHAAGGRHAQAEDEALEARLDSLRKALANVKVRPQMGEPPAYYGLLLADGDRMGLLIDKASMRDANAHRQVSAALAAFAQSVPALMGRHQGACIYSGGDDVLGLVVLPHALTCARELAQAFRRAMAPVARLLELPEQDWPTLSVGIAVAHHLQPLGDARELADEAEKAAKGNSLPEDRQRNALAVVVKPRSGSTYRFRLRWDEQDELALFEQWLLAFGEGRLPRGLPHQLEDEWSVAASAFPAGTAGDVPFATFWRGMVTTRLARKREMGGASPLTSAAAGAVVEQLCDVGEDEDRGSARRRLRDRLDLMHAALWLSGCVEPAGT